MVDLPFGRAVVVLALSLAGCAGTGRSAPPQSGSAIREAMSSAITAGDRPALTRAAVMLARMDGGMSDRGFGGFSAILDPGLLEVELDRPGDPIEALHNWYRTNLRAYGATLPAAEVPADFKLVEGIAYDPATRRLFVGTVIEGRLAYLEKGAWHEIPVGFPRSGLFGMAIDAKRRLLWIGTGAVAETGVRSDPLAGLIAIDLDGLKVVQRVRVPSDKPGVVGDVTVGPDRTVYASNSESGAIHRYRPGGAGMADLVPPGLFKNPQGMALSRDGRNLYVADYHSGLWIVRLRDGRVTPIAIDRPAMLDGIDGLVKLPGSNTLLATQNGTAPRRILRLTLSPDGTRVARIQPLQVLPAEAHDPTLATLVGGNLWFVGDGQWERYGPGGKPRDATPPRPTPLLRIDTDRSH